jgi:hypothetical protein
MEVEVPGGICAASVDPLAASAPRCSILSVNIFGLRRSLSLGGFAEANFPDVPQDELNNVQSEGPIKVAWERAVFRGRDWLLGDVVARLNPVKQARQNASLVTSNRRALGDDFFPATNRNYLSFDLYLPRFGFVLESDDPIINQATILKIPPFGSVYSLERPVEFRGARNGVTSRFASATIEKCSVKLVELRNIDVGLVETGRDNSFVTFEASFLNRTTESEIEISWMVWPEDDGADEVFDIVRLGARPVRQQIKISTPILSIQRWLAIAICRPFHTDAASITRFPINDG